MRTTEQLPVYVQCRPPARRRHGAALAVVIAGAALAAGCGESEESQSSYGTSRRGFVATTAGDGGTTPACASGLRWNRGDEGSGLMHPGRACIDCHAREGEGPRFTIAGTVYAGANDPDECAGIDPLRGTEVQITDAQGRVLHIEPNAAGNFYTKDSVTFPIRARVIRNGMSRVMVMAQSTGDCNSCHTAQGLNDAPGRITVTP